MSDHAFEQNWRKRFERYAQFDDDAKIAGWSAYSLQTRVAAFKQHWAPPLKRGFWVDIGCGAGTYTQYLIAQQQTVLAMDYSLPTLQKAKSLTQASAFYSTADVRAMPIRQHSVDGILCFGVLQALSEPLEALDELNQLIQQNGEIWIDGLNRRSLRFFWEWLQHIIKKQPYRLHYVSPWALMKRFKQLDLQELQIIWLPILPAKWRKAQGAINWLCNRLFKPIPFMAALISHAFIVKAKRSI